jgi:hypothetical protein
MENDKRILTELDRSKQMMSYTTKPKKVIKSEPVKPEEPITEDRVVTLSDFVNG